MALSPHGFVSQFYILLISRVREVAILCGGVGVGQHSVKYMTHVALPRDVPYRLWESSAVNITQLVAHEVGKSILCHVGQRHTVPK